MTTLTHQIIEVDIRALAKDARRVADELSSVLPVIKLGKDRVLVDASRTSTGKVKDSLKRVLYELRLKKGFRVLSNRQQVHVVRSPTPTGKGHYQRKPHTKRGRRPVAGAFCPHCGKYSTSRSDYWTHVGVHYVGFVP